MKKYNNKGIALSQPKGFTLIELLLYMLIFPTLLLVISSIFGSIVDTQLESRSYSSVDLDARYVLAKLAYDFQSADSSDPLNNNIILPATASAGPVLELKINSITHTYSISPLGRLQLYKLASYDLTGSDTTVSNLNFQRIGGGGNTDSIRVSFRLTSNILRKSGPDYRDVATTFSMP